MRRRRGLKRVVMIALAASVAIGGGVALAQIPTPDLPQIKINHVDTSEAPKITVYASVLGNGLKPVMQDQLDEITLLKKPEGRPADPLFTYIDGEIEWPKSLTEEEIAEKEENLPEVLPAVDLEDGAAIVVVVPGFQAEKYREGELGNRSRNGAGLFFKKLGKANRMNVIWYNDFVWSWVEAAGRMTQLTKLDTQIERCRKWAEEQLPTYGEAPEEEEEEGGGLAPNEAHCGLTTEYGEFGDFVKRSPYSGFWPQLFGLGTPTCAPPKREHAIQTAGLRDRQATAEDPTNDGRLKALDTALWMLTQDAAPGQPRVLILTGDGRDGYIYRQDDCRAKYQADCADDDEIKDIRNARKRSAAMNACADEQMKNVLAIEQGAFADRLDSWLGQAKAANIRIYSVVHPDAEDFEADRLAVLAWRSGGTSRRATDANEVVVHYEDLITELNHQIAVTFHDDEAVPGSDVAYEVWVKAGGASFRAPTFEAKVAPVVEKPFLTEFMGFGEDKLGTAGFIAVLAVVALILLVIFLKIGKKIFGGGGKAAKKAAKKGAKGKGKKKDKARQKAIKAAMKKKKKLAKAKAKAKKG